jgi:ferredoxin-NADP reductase
VLLTLPIREVLPATLRARIVRIDLGRERFPYLPGQALLIATHGHQQRQPYSLAGAPEDAEHDRWLELLVRVGPDGSPGSHLTLEQGAIVDIEGPFGGFTLPPEPRDRRFVFIAGGTGIAPLRAMLRHALHGPHEQIGLFYSARAPGEFAYETELQSLAREGRIELKQTVTRDVASDNWTGSRGRIGRGDLAPLIHDPATMCFICGPPALVDDMPRLLGELGIAGHRVRIEEWT